MQTSDRRAWLRQALLQPGTSASQPSLSGMERHEHESWEPDFNAWATAECVYRDSVHQSIASLHVHFCEWAVRAKSVPCRRDVFERLLWSNGFATRDGLVCGLMLRSDYKALEVSR